MPGWVRLARLSSHTVNRNEGKMIYFRHRPVTLAEYPRRQPDLSLHERGGTVDAWFALDAPARGSGAGLGDEDAPIVRFRDGSVLPGPESPVQSPPATPQPLVLAPALPAAHQLP